MDKLISELKNWCHELSQYATPTWNSLPDLDLYMDQVITYLERQTALFPQGDEKLITPAMINNYVKSEIIPRPVQKKYSREHLAYLLAITMLKQVLPIPDISRIIATQAVNSDLSQLFDRLRVIQDEALQATAERVNSVVSTKTDDDVKELLGMLALKLTFEANASILAAKKILHLLTPQDKQRTDDKRKKSEAEAPPNATK